MLIYRPISAPREYIVKYTELLHSIKVKIMTLELQRKLKLKRAVACLLAVLITALTACRAHRNSNMENPTDAYADEICQKLTEQGVRTPGSEAAKAAAEYIKSEFQKLGYVPE